MALPKLNDAPKYRVTVPSTGQEVSFRPFLVKEQKMLLIASETQDRVDMVKAIINTINACTTEDIKGELTTFDVDYLFTKIRSKSVGETRTLLISCTECEMNNEVVVELDKIEVDSVATDVKINITDDIVLEMRYPTYEDFMKNEKLLQGTSATESLLELLITCIATICTEEERYSTKDSTREELIDFIDSMTTQQFEAISAFVNDMPTLKEEVKFTCAQCNTENSKVLEGIDDFF